MEKMERMLTVGTTLIVSMITTPVFAENGMVAETESLSVLALMAALYICVYMVAIGSVVGLVALLFRGTRVALALFANVIPENGGNSAVKSRA